MDSSTYEAALENMILSNIEFAQLRGFPDVFANTKQQFRLQTGKVCDIFSYEIIGNSFSCKIFELKRGQLGISSLLQVVEYGIDTAKYSVHSFEEVNIELYLVGADINNEILNLFGWGVNVNIITYEYKFDGIHFENLSLPGTFPTPYWVKRPHEMMERPPDSDIETWIEKLKI